MAGPVNVATPRPVTNREFTVTLGRILHRPTLFRIPAVALRCAFGELAEEVLLSSVRALPGRLTSSGFEFQYPDLLGALRKVLESHQLFKETYSYELIDPDL
jgi:NAD dependent epimerase/dehydratase family enzyme